MSEPIAAAEGIDETTAVSSDAVTLSLDGAPAAAPSEGGKRRFTGRKRPERQSTNDRSPRRAVVTGPILFIFFFFVIPREADFWWAYALYGMAAGLLISWSAPCNNAILSDVFPEATFPLAYGVAQLAEGSVSAWAPFVVAIIAENLFGVGDLENFDCKTDEEKDDDARGLALAIFSVCCVGWGSCAMVVFGFYYYYPRESRALNPHLTEPVAGPRQTSTREGDGDEAAEEGRDVSAVLQPAHEHAQSA